MSNSTRVYNTDVNTNNSAVHNIVADQGATFSYTVVFKDAKRKANDVTGYTARMQLRPATNSSTVTAELTTENGRITVYGTEGRFDLLISATDMSAIEAGTYVYDLEVEAPSTGFVEKLLLGNFTIRPEVTR